ncbi:MAG: lysylphosphatidylglycerol synthase transmembrane domain-containing protein [Pseudomonadota bacterium]
MKKNFLSLLLSLILLVGLGIIIEWDQVLSTVVQAEPEWLIGAMACVVLARLVITRRWQVILHAMSCHAEFRRLFRVVSAGIGVGSLPPTSVGPDVARGVLLHADQRDGASQMTTSVLVSSLLLDRYAATLGTLLVAMIGTFYSCPRTAASEQLVRSLLRELRLRYGAGTDAAHVIPWGRVSAEPASVPFPRRKLED